MWVNRSARAWAAAALMVLVSGGCTWIGRVSVGNAGGEGDAPSGNPAISATGRYVAFASEATNLVTGDTNTFGDVFVRDTVAGTTTRVSLSNTGQQATGGTSGSPTISSDGRYIAFRSGASNLVDDDTNGVADVFVRDTIANTTTRVNLDGTGAQTSATAFDPAISGDGRHVAFISVGSLVPDDTNANTDVYVRDTVAATTTRVSVDGAGVQGDHGSIDPSISGDGQYVAFASEATNLVDNDTNNTYDTYVRDTVNGTTTRVSVSSTGTQADDASLVPAITGDGQTVAFESTATNLVDIDTNGGADIFVHNLVTGATERASVDKDENQADGVSNNPSISADGRFVAFESWATNLVGGDLNAVQDVFVRDTVRGITNRMSTRPAGIEVTDASNLAAISGDGRYVAFNSFATNLVRDDNNHVLDVFVRANPEPATRMFTPDAFFPGTTTAMTVDGFDFFPGTQLLVDGAGVTFDNFTIVNDTTITVDVVVAVNAPAGVRNVFVRAPATGPGPAFVAIGFCQGCITVRPFSCVGGCLLPKRTIAHR